jgi:hypothetical protein
MAACKAWRRGWLYRICQNMDENCLSTAHCTRPGETSGAFGKTRAGDYGISGATLPGILDMQIISFWKAA